MLHHLIFLNIFSEILNVQKYWINAEQKWVEGWADCAKLENIEHKKWEKIEKCLNTDRSKKQSIKLVLT
jgi:hypothetical protein